MPVGKQFYLVYLLVPTGATEGWDVPDSPWIRPESRPQVQNAEEEQGTCRHSVKSGGSVP